MKKQSLFYKLNVTAKISQILAIRFFNQNKKADITFNQYEILSVLKNGNFYQRDLAKYLCKGTSNLSKDLKTLEDNKYIKRVLETHNNRMVKTIHLTEIGEKILNKNGALIENYTNEFLNIYQNDEHKQFEEFLDRLKDKLTESVDIVFE